MISTVFLTIDRSLKVTRDFRAVCWPDVSEEESL